MSLQDLHQHLERQLKTLLSLGGLTNNERLEVSKMISHAEYSLALQVYCHGVIENARPISEDEIAIVDDLFSKMGIKDADETDGDYWLWKKFSSAVGRG